MPHEKGHGNKDWYDKMQKETTGGRAGKFLQDTYNKSKKKKKKKKKSLMDSLPGLKMIVEGAKSRGIFSTNEENRRRKLGLASRDKQSGESRMRKGKLYEDAPKGGGKVAKSMAESQKLKDFSPKGSGGKAEKTIRDSKKNTTTISDAQKRRGASPKSKTYGDPEKGKKAATADKKVLAEKSKAGTPSSTPKKEEPKTFKEAFARARKEGKASFKYKGKSYASVTKDEVNKAFKSGKIKKKTLRAYLNMKKKK